MLYRGNDRFVLRINKIDYIVREVVCILMLKYIWHLIYC